MLAELKFPQVQRRRLGVALIGLACTLVVGCATKGTTCGYGATAVGGTCVPTTPNATCGAGTTLLGGQCVLVDAGVADVADAGADLASTDAVPETDAQTDAAADSLDSADVSVDVCAPQCAGKTCGPDSCGGVCGTCSGGDLCNGGVCGPCKPACAFKECGDDGCGGSCGTCNGGLQCLLGKCAPLPPDASCQFQCGTLTASGCSCLGSCTAMGNCCVDFSAMCGCVADCAGKSCGPDGCGGSCGVCTSGELCTSGVCGDNPCDPDPCSTHGDCAPLTGACTCASQYTGAQCAACAAGLANYPTCGPDACIGNTCSGHGVCLPSDGTCTCDPGFGGGTCNACVVSGGVWPNCPNPCSPGACDDTNPCTSDLCNAAGDCVHLAIAATCSDGDACTENDACANGVCTGATKVCDLAVNATGDSDAGTCTLSHCTLRQAIDAANANPDATVIHFAIDAAIALSTPLPTVSAPLTIDGSGHHVVLDGQHKVRVFTSTADLTLAHVVIEAGHTSDDGGGVWQEAGTLTVSDARFDGCDAGNLGGAIRTNGNASIDHCTFAANVALSGGAIGVDYTLDVQDSAFEGNSATNGGGGAIWTNAPSVATVNRCSFLNNSATTGGGISAGTTSIAVINSTFHGNSATGAGGGLYGNGDTLLLHCTLVGNSAPTTAGGIAVSSIGWITLRNTWIASNTGGDCDGFAAETTASWVADGTCGGTSNGVAFTGTLGAWGGPTPTIAPAAGSPLADAADDGACGDSRVGGIDQRGVARPIGAHCDIGAFEGAVDGCAGLSDGTTCSDGDACTLNDFCTANACAPGSAANCDDGSDCTADSCSFYAGCVHAAATGACDDGNFCTAGDVCGAGTCTGTSTVNCDDANACTADSCDPKTGCVHANVATACDDGNPCTEGDTCQGGTCKGATICAPPPVTGLVAHYASTTPGSVVVDSTGMVTTWNDLSGQGHDLTASGTDGPILDPLGIYGTPAIDFAGGKGLATSAFGETDAATVFVVVRIGNAATDGVYAHHGDKGTAWSIAQIGVSTQVLFRSAMDNSGDALTLQPGQSYILTARIGGNDRMFAATQSWTSSTSATGNGMSASDQALALGRAVTGEASNAAIGEFLYYNAALSDADRDAIVVWLRAKWQFAVPKPDLCWYDASDTALLDMQDATHVSIWHDRSGQGRDAQAVGSVGPALNAAATPSGQAALHWTDASTLLKTAAFPLGPLSTLFVVAKLDTVVDQAALLQHGLDWTLVQSNCCGQPPALGFDVGLSSWLATVPIASGAWQVITATEGATVASLNLAPGTASDVNAPGVSFTNSLYIGNSPDQTAASQGLIAEIRGYAQALHPMDRAAVAIALRGKFGF